MRQRILQTMGTQVLRHKQLPKTVVTDCKPQSLESKLTKTLANGILKGDLDQAKQEMRWMLDHLLTKQTKRPTPAQLSSELLENNPTLAEKISEFVKERTENAKPLQYILGNQPFGELDLLVRPPVLIPRWETEEWSLNLCTMLNNVDLMTKNDRRKLRILDIGTGSGCIALILASRLPKGRVEVIGVDQSDLALALADENKQRNENLLHNPVAFHKLDIMEDSAVAQFIQKHGDVDMIVSNPPYIPPAQYMELAPEVKQWEDKDALLADDEGGIKFYKRILDLAVNHSLLHSVSQSRSQALLPLYAQLPQLVVEVGGHAQATKVAALFKSQINHSRVLKDLAGQDRVVLGYRSDINL